MIKRTRVVSAICCLAALAGGANAAPEHDSQTRESSGSSEVNPVVQWNRALLAIVRTPGAQPATVHPTRNFALMHAAIYDAVNAIERTHRPYQVRLDHVSRRASREAAAAAAAHGVLVSLYPALRDSLDQQLAQSLAPIPNGESKREGIRVGRLVGDRMVALRSKDGSQQPPIPYEFGTARGDYQSTPPNFPPQPVFTHWSAVAPFALRRADQFRPAPPPTLPSPAYARAFNEVKALGTGAAGGTATEEQMLIGRFWAGPIQNYWNEIAQAASLRRELTTAQSARLFALLNLSFADAVIAFYDAKYAHNFWRPVTAIRAADTNENPDTKPDPDWLPLAGNTPADPSYPGAHAVISGAAEETLVFFFEKDDIGFSVTSEVLPGVERSFPRFSAGDDEASASRIYAGVHFEFDESSGQRLGRQVGQFVTSHFLTPRDHRDSDDAN